MNFCRRTFNLYLLLAVALPLVSGCEYLKTKMSRAPVVELRIHVESVAAAPGTGQSVSIIRSQPVTVDIAREPILTESDVVAARLVETAGGFAVEVKFDETAGWALEQYSAVNPGKHLAILGLWGDKPTDGRWLAAPRMARRIAGAELMFTPDASREEMEELVKRLNVIAKENLGLKSKQ